MTPKFPASAPTVFAAQFLSPHCLAECVLLRPVYSFQHRHPVTDSWAFLWRVRLTQLVETLQFFCRINLSHIIDGDPESGERLASQAWESENIRLSIGTQDEDALCCYAERGDRMPARYAFDTTNLWPEYVNYLSDGMSVTFNNAEASDKFQIHFAVAWTFDDKESVATWFAVDTDAESILAGASQSPA